MEVYRNERRKDRRTGDSALVAALLVLCVVCIDAKHFIAWLGSHCDC